MFVGREKERAILENCYSAHTIQVVFLTGESSIGKTELLKYFGKRKQGFYYSVQPSTEKLNQRLFCSEFQNQCCFAKNIHDWQDAVNKLLSRSESEKILLIIDDAQNLTTGFSGFIFYLFSKIKQNELKLRLMIIFSGRKEMKIEDSMVNNKEICLTHIRLEPLSYLEAAPFYQNFDNDEKVLLYGVTGGYPCYLQYIQGDLNVKDNLYKLFFSEYAVLRKVAEHLLEEKLRQPGVYHAILQAVATGSFRMNEIASSVGIECNKLSKYVNVLVKEQFLQRIVSAEKKQERKQCKKTFYIIKNNMLTFWYRFVLPFESDIILGRGHKILRTQVLPNVDPYTNKIFMDICIQHCCQLEKNRKFSFPFTKIGLYWDKVISPEEIMFFSEDGTTVCLGKCCWDKQKVDIDLIRNLERQSGVFTASDFYYIFFARRGFTDKALRYSAHHQNLLLVSLYYLK